MNLLNAWSLMLPVLLTFTPMAIEADEPHAFETLAAEYQHDIQPLLKRFCLDCHSTEDKEGELDLERFMKLDNVRTAPRTWQKVDEMLTIGEMPPDGSKQLSDAQNKQLRDWAKRYLDAEALSGAGDPGPVVLRRLTNAEYTWTIRDLTGVPLSPARQFPSEGAAGEGFTNAGNALVVSPGLLRKYLDAGKEIASHAVLLPDGFRFSSRTTRRDWTDELLAEIRTFYGEFSRVERLAQHYGNNATHLGKAGRIAFDDYFAATLAERDALTVSDKTIDDVAAERRLNAKYLGILWSALNDNKPSIILDQLRLRWRKAKPEDAESLAADVARWQQGLWTFNPVGLLGRKGYRSRWMEPVSPLLTHHELRLSIPAPAQGAEPKDFVVSLVAGDAGDGSEHDYVVWTQPRLVAAGKPDEPLRNWITADGKAIDAASVSVHAPAVITVRVPAEFAGRQLVTTVSLDQKLGPEGSVQVDLVAGTPEAEPGLQPSHYKVAYANVNIGADTRMVSYHKPILVGDDSDARKRLESAFNDFRDLFPAAICYTQIVPVDEILTLTLLYREDDHLLRLMLDDEQAARLDRLWNELRYVSLEPLRLVEVLDSLLETTIDHPQAGVFEDAVKPFNARATAFRKTLKQSEQKHLDALAAFVSRAWRRPFSAVQRQELTELYRRLRGLDLPHEEAFRLTLARVFVASPFLYRLEEAPEGAEAATISHFELATRLSYFLWSSMPDDELRRVAENGTLHDPDVLARQTKRMLKDSRVRRLATEFACQWLHIHEFDPLEQKSDKHFPEFAALRSAMYEESILFFTDLFQRDGSFLDLLNADHTFVNKQLADFYGIPAVEGDAWRRVDGTQQHGRGGVLGLATTLAKQSGATRTSPILRGNWISEVLLGEKLPKPPKDVPQLADTIPEGLTERELIQRHSADAACAKCHARIDPFGFALEGFDAIGRRREKDGRGLAIDSRTTLPDGTQIDGLSGLRDYLLTKRRNAFLRQFCRKLLGYALGRELQLSDRPLIDEMMTRLEKNDYRFSIAVDTIVFSDQFRMIRGQQKEP